MTLFKAFILGLIQGLSEFLPISSSGHLSIAGAIMKIDAEGESLLSFNILLHIATLAAVFVVYRKDIAEMVKAFFEMAADLFKGKGLRLQEFEYRRLIVMLIVGTLPAVIAALLFGDVIESPSLWQIGIFLYITAILLFVSDKLKNGKTELKDIKISQALCAGLFQGLGVLPGISRSGSTIVGGMLGKIKKEEAVRFSFLLSIPAILGALVFDIKNLFGGSRQIFSLGSAAVGMITAAVSGYFAIKFLLKIVAEKKLSYFSYYCLAAGSFAIILNFIL